MPVSLARRLLIIAAVDGLIISPLTRSRSPPTTPQSAVHVAYNSRRISTKSAEEKQLGDPSQHSVEAYGIAGLLNVSPTSAFLVAITDRRQVATVETKYPIYVITNIALIPLSSQDDAVEAMQRAGLARPQGTDDGSASDTEAGIEAEEIEERAPDTKTETAIEDEIQDEVTETIEAVPSAQKSLTSIGDDVLRKRGAYGRFAAKWFSKRGWTLDKRRAEGMSDMHVVDPDIMLPPEGGEATKTKNQSAPLSSVIETKPAEAGTKDGVRPPSQGTDSKVEQAAEEAADAVKGRVTHTLTPKLLHTTKLLLAGSRSFYFSYDWDITRAWGKQMGVKEDRPLHQVVDPSYFWNGFLQKPFIESKQEHLVLPLMQGFIGQTSFTAPPSQPRGDTSEVTEMPDRPSGEAIAKARDFIEPLADSQRKFLLTLISRRSIRRAGLRYLRRGVDDSGNTANAVETEQLLSTPAWSHVFSYLQIRGSIPLYFSQSPYSLKPKPVLLQSSEANQAAFKAHFANLRSRYGDVHAISLVEQHGPEAIVGNRYRDAVANLPPKDRIGWMWFDFHRECRGMKFENVSCLFSEISPVTERFSYTETKDRKILNTQSGILRTNCMDCLDRTNVVQSGAAREALSAQLAGLGVQPPEEGSNWFNILWADNGDAISKQYASTAALKGDFTRTRRRGLGGALTDFSLTLARYFTNVISDYFTQAAIDFLLGNVTAQVFVDFEAEMTSADPAVSLERTRDTAVEVARKIVVEDESEDVKYGAAFLSPRTDGHLRGAMLEKVLLVTDRALYICEFDWALEKVPAFERVDAEDVEDVRYGTYITSSLAPSQLDPERNRGFVIRFRKTKRDIVRVNTRCLSAEVETQKGKEMEGGRREGEKAVAFKAMSAEVSRVEDVVRVLREIGVRGEEKEIVGAEEAKKGTGLWETLEYRVKKLVWA